MRFITSQGSYYGPIVLFFEVFIKYPISIKFLTNQNSTPRFTVKHLQIIESSYSTSTEDTMALGKKNNDL